MTADDFEARVRTLVLDARQAGCSNEMMIDVLHDIAEALRERTGAPGVGQGGTVEALTT